MNTDITRRQFVKTSALAGAAFAALSPSINAIGANNKIRAAVMGTNGRGIAHINGLLSVPNVEIAYICDVDDRAIEKGIKAVTARQQAAPRGIKDFRQALDDKSLDVLTIAAPNHWHAPATILGCSAGKHVYVEKPGSHNPREAELMVAAARKYNRKVQMGNQRRSWPWIIEAIEKLKAGEIGALRFARTWYNNKRESIGRGKPAPVPVWLDYSLWQGPAPERPFKDNLVHYNWHWHWHWGNGELGNNGVHSLDVARWGLGVDLPRRVTCAGGRYHFNDDQETPDTYVATFDYGDKGITWEGHSCHPRGFEGAGFGIHFYGDKGSLVLAGNNWRIYDLNGNQLAENGGKNNDAVHFDNFISGIREGARLNAEIEDAQKSAMLCHLGNIAIRTGQTLDVDPVTGRINANKAASKLWGREYRRGWEPKV